VSARATVEVYRASKSRGGARLVALALADCAHTDGSGWLPFERLQSMTRLTAPAVRRALVELIDLREVNAHEIDGRIHFALRVGDLS
jgi:hypothetical protein